ncbi:hypothetical protein ACH5RR_023684 [Cinchona calisaya]|uniref:Uncharacterized protein n=1 Tax=Cinchona calisaya TaxID=153742 RepID=A0ABD2ZF81_9GENT
MQIYTSLVATCISTIGLFASGEWRTLHGEMNAFSTGRLSYVTTLVWTAYSFVGSHSVAALIVFRDKMNGVKIIATLMALRGFTSYIYQNYIDNSKARKTRANAEGATNDSLC